MNNITIILCSIGVGSVTLIASIAMGIRTGVSDTYSLTSGIISGLFWAALIGYMLFRQRQNARKP